LLSRNTNPVAGKLEEDLTQSFCSDSGELLLNHQALLRGDGTMGCLRLLSQHRNLQTETRVWYQGTMFRRQHQQNISQFHQLGVETFGYSDIGIEIELISLQYDFLNLFSYYRSSTSKLTLPEIRKSLRIFVMPYNNTTVLSPPC
jgi:histidyl-tRNA synthetase